jgi:hypothetical protein
MAAFQIVHLMLFHFGVLHRQVVAANVYKYKEKECISRHLLEE